MTKPTESELRALVKAAFFKGEKVLCAVSGGADSVALLRLLKDIEAEGYIRLYAAHFEHGIRGETSVSDMRFVESLCRELRVPLSVGRGNAPEEAALRKAGLEETARDMRHAFLRAERERLCADCVALAHHADDQAETVLMRLLRGSAGAGAAGMRPRSGRLVRPLLNVRKSALVQYLEDNGWTWREDATNAIGDTPRNAIRLRVTPVLEEIRPGCVEAICRFAAVQAEESDFLDACAREWLRENARIYPYGVLVSVRAFPNGAVLSRALKIVCGKNANFQDISRLRELCAARGGNPIEYEARGIRALCAKEGLWLLNGIAPPEPVFLPERGVARFGDIGDMEISPCEPIPLKSDPNEQALSARALRGARLRAYREGDRVRPMGMAGGSKLLSDLFAEAGIPRAARGYWPVLERGGEILWAVGLRIAESAKLTPGCEALKLQWRPRGPKRYEPTE